MLKYYVAVMLAAMSFNASAGNCHPTTLALETGIVAATRLPIKDTPIIWIDLDYTSERSEDTDSGRQCEGNVAIGNIYDNSLVWVTTVAPN